MGEIRATRAGEKEARRASLLAAADELLRGWSYADITVDRIAEACGVSKGTVYLYYRTKESLFLGLYEQHLMAWYSELESLATRGTDTVEATAAAQVITSTLAADPTLIRLHGLIHSTSSRNVDPESLLAFRRRQFHNMNGLAAALAQRIRGIDDSRALRFLVQLEAVVGGLAWATTPPAPLARAYEEEGLDPFLIDFEKELREIATSLLR